MKLPLLVFGKPPITGQMPDSYVNIIRHEAFSNDVMDIIQRIKNGFTWASSKDDKVFADCFGFWSLHEQESSNALVIRFSDQGKDNRGRPHSLRIEAAILDNKKHLESGRLLAGLLCEQVWPDRQTYQGSSDTIELIPAKDPDEELVQAIETQLSTDKKPFLSMLIGDPRSFRNTVFKFVHEQTAELKITKPISYQPSGNQMSIPDHQKIESERPQTKKPSRFLPYVALLCFGFGIALGFYWGQHSEGAWKERAEKAEMQIASQKNVDENLRKQYDELSIESKQCAERLQQQTKKMKRLVDVLSE